MKKILLATLVLGMFSMAAGCDNKKTGPLPTFNSSGPQAAPETMPVLKPPIPK